MLNDSLSLSDSDVLNDSLSLSDSDALNDSLSLSDSDVSMIPALYETRILGPLDVRLVLSVSMIHFHLVF